MKGSINNLIIDENGEVQNLLDTEKFPLIDPYLEDIFLMDNINNNYREQEFGYYSFNDVYVPRVSSILKETINKEYLVTWAAKVGYNNMNKIRDNALETGTIVHGLIEYYLLNNSDMTDIIFNPKAERAYNNFKSWIYYINSRGYEIDEVIATEKQISCPLYGGTVDAILKINGKNYIVDWKTSSSISYEYIIQTCAYMWLINNGYCPELPHIDGVGIVRIDKSKKIFEDMFLNESIPEQKIIIDSYIKGFGALLNSFYNNRNMKILFEQCSGCKLIMEE